MELALRIFISLAIGAATAYTAFLRGRDCRIWFLIGSLFGIFGILLIYLLPNLKEETNEPEKELKPALPFSPLEAASPNSELLPYGFRDKQWFYLTSSREQIGPITYKELTEKWTSQSIIEDSFVWCEGMADWYRLNQLNLFK